MFRETEKVVVRGEDGSRDLRIMTTAQRVHRSGPTFVTITVTYADGTSWKAPLLRKYTVFQLFNHRSPMSSKGWLVEDQWERTVGLTPTLTGAISLATNVATQVANDLID
jgi:hypothetical protein